MLAGSLHKLAHSIVSSPLLCQKLLYWPVVSLPIPQTDRCGRITTVAVAICASWPASCLALRLLSCIISCHSSERLESWEPLSLSVGVETNILGYWFDV